MDQSTLVAEQLSEGRRLVERFAADGHPVSAAFWGKQEESGRWELYLASDLADREGMAAAFITVRDCIARLGAPALDASEVSFIRPTDPVVQEIVEAANKNARKLSRPYSSLKLMGRGIDQAYIYPPQFFTPTQVQPMTTDDLSREIVRLMSRGPGFVQPAHVVLKDGTSFNGLPFALEMGPHWAMVARFMVDGESAPRAVRLDEIASIS